MTRMVRMAASAAATAVVAAAAPAAAQAATVTITGDSGVPVAISPAAPPTIRNMDVRVMTTIGEGEAERFSVSVLGPDGAPAAIAATCRIGPTATSYVNYRGNGQYRIVLTRYGDTGCATPTSATTYAYGVAASVAIGQPQNWLYTREPNSFSTISHNLPVNLNPGAISYEVRYARGGEIGPDGAISGPSASGFVDRTTGTTPIRFDRPGDWVVVARAGADGYFTPWSAPVRVRAKAPFDLSRVAFPDARGPRYKLKGYLRDEVSAGRRVIVSLARGRKGGKFKRLGKAKIRRNGTFKLRFTQRRTGRYRIRYTFRGSGLMARGKITQQIRIRRRLI